MTLVPLNLLFTHLLKRAWKTESMKRKIFRKSLSVRTTVVKHTLLRQPQTNKFCSKIFKVGIKSGRLPFSNELTPLKQQQLTPALLL